MTARRLGALAAAAAVALAGCGSEDPKEQARERVDAYAKAENAVLAKLAPDVDRINRAYVAFSKGKLKPRRAVARLTAAEQVVRDVQREASALEPPAQARELHALLERYLGLTVGLAQQTRRLAGYEPDAQAALKPLPQINRALRDDLDDATEPAAQADVLEAFTEGLDGVLADLRAIEAPAVQLPSHRDQIRRLERSRKLGLELRDALRDEDPEAVADLLTRFREQASEPIPAAKLRRRGLDAYGERIDALKTAANDIRREQLRLYRSLETDS